MYTHTHIYVYIYIYFQTQSTTQLINGDKKKDNMNQCNDDEGGFVRCLIKVTAIVVLTIVFLWKGLFWRVWMSLFSRSNYVFIALPGIHDAAQAQQERFQTHRQEAHFCGQKEVLLIFTVFCNQWVVIFLFCYPGHLLKSFSQRLRKCTKYTTIIFLQTHWPIIFLIVWSMKCWPAQCGKK